MNKIYVHCPCGKEFNVIYKEEIEFNCPNCKRDWYLYFNPKVDDYEIYVEEIKKENKHVEI